MCGCRIRSPLAELQPPNTHLYQNKSHLFHHSLPQGLIPAGGEDILKVSYFPGVPETFQRFIHLQVAHMEPEIIDLRGEGVFPRICLDLPRNINGINRRTDPHFCVLCLISVFLSISPVPCLYFSTSLLCHILNCCISLPQPGAHVFSVSLFHSWASCLISVYLCFTPVPHPYHPYSISPLCLMPQGCISLPQPRVFLFSYYLFSRDIYSIQGGHLGRHI